MAHPRDLRSLAEFQALASSNAKVIVDFHAEWCGPCKAIAPTYDALAAANPSIIFTRCDVDAAEDLAAFAEISAMPTFKTYLNGTCTGTLQGASKGELEKLVAALNAA